MAEGSEALAEEATRRAAPVSVAVALELRKHRVSAITPGVEEGRTSEEEVALAVADRTLAAVAGTSVVAAAISAVVAAAILVVVMAEGTTARRSPTISQKRSAGHLDLPIVVTAL